MSSKTISIDPQHFKLGNSKKKNLTFKNNTNNSGGTKINIHNSNIRELLLSKLQQHREKTKKKILQTTTPPIEHKLQMNTFDECNPISTNHVTNPLSSPLSNPMSSPISNQITSELPNNIVTSESSMSSMASMSSIIPDKPYGILKNGIKPTYKTWSQSKKNYEYDYQENNSNHNSNIEINVASQPSDSSSIQTVEQKPVQMIQEREIKKNYKLGLNKKNKTISILIKNDKTRKKVETDKSTYKKTPISTVKNYLKKKNFIRFGASAPTQLMRDMYENLKLCGDVINENPKLLVENLTEPL